MENSNIFSSPSFRSWVKSLVDEAKRTGVSFPDSVLEEIEKANESSRGFNVNPELLTVLHSLYSEVVNDGLTSELKISAQPFAREFRFWQSPEEALRSIFGTAEKTGSQTPDAFDLFRRYPNIPKEAISMMREAEGLAGFVSSSYLRDYLANIATALERIASEGELNPTAARNDIEALGKSVRAISGIMKQAEMNHLYTAIPHVIESAFIAGRNAEGEEASELSKALWQLERAFELGYSGARLRELSLEVQIRAWSILEKIKPESEAAMELDDFADHASFVDVGDGDPEVEAGRLAEKIFSREGEPSLAELATIAWLHLLVGKPADAVRSIREFEIDDSVAGAALLMASWRMRIRNRSPLFESVVLQGIRNALLLEREPIPVRGDEERSKAPWLQIPLADEIESIVASASKRGEPIYVEFGPGDAPVGLEYAKAVKGAHVISIEPDVRPIDWSVINVTYPPRNYSFLMGRAEELAAFSAETPLVEGVVMVAPEDRDVMKLILSAAIAVKPGGEIRLFQRMDAMFPGQLLEGMGFETKVYALDPKAGPVPPSKHLPPGEPVRMVSIEVPSGGFLDEAVEELYTSEEAPMEDVEAIWASRPSRASDPKRNAMGAKILPLIRPLTR